jgi:hypothetical protein
MDKENCQSCGSDNIVRGIHVGKTAEIGDIGLSYQSAVILTGTEPMVADLCTACGVVVRLRVQNTNRKWKISGN